MIGAKCLWENLVGGQTKNSKKVLTEREILLKQQEKSLQQSATPQKQADPEIRKALMQRLN